MTMPPGKADQKATLDVAAWAFNIVTSVGIIIVNKALMATYGFSFGNSLRSTCLLLLLVVLESLTNILFSVICILVRFLLSFLCHPDICLLFSYMVEKEKED